MIRDVVSKALSRPRSAHMKVRVVFFILCLIVVSVGRTADCPDSSRCANISETACRDGDPRTAAKRVPPDPDTPILTSADITEVSDNGDLRYRQNVEVRQGDRVLRAEEIDYNDANQSLRIPGAVELSDPSLAVRGEGARIEAAGTAVVDSAKFEIPARAGHGSAEQIRLSKNGELDLRDVRYTTCPLPNPSWELKVGRLHIDQQAHTGFGSSARVDFEGVPILYVPYISFPVGNEPKSGLLFPEFGQSSLSGWQFSLPYYWRIAPNYDATFTPTYFSTRGIDFGGEFRFLTGNSKGTLNVRYLPNDSQTQTDRSFASIDEQTDFTSRLRFAVSGVNLSDDAWFEDFGGATYTNLMALPRSGLLEYRGDEWMLTARAENFQIIDPLVTPDERPYTMLPQISFHGYFPDRLFGMTAAIDSELAAFQHNGDIGPAGAQRLYVAPELKLPLRSHGMYLEPAVGFRYIAFHIDDPVTPNSTPSVIAPNFSVDSGMTFERESGSARIQTLEPRILYAYVPYRTQDYPTFPILDTTPPDFNLIQLFETDRYVGSDRIGDVNHVALGVTTRLIDASDGRQFLAATVGQLYRFSAQRVAIPNEVPEDAGSSDIVAEFALNAFRHWSAHVGLEWDPSAQRDARTEVSFQYRADQSHVINFGYRYQRADTLTIVPPSGSPTAQQELKQIDTSAAWSIGNSWSLYGRVIYSILDQAAIERFGGFEYRTCCWGVRLLARRYISTTTGATNLDFMAQLELNGLANVGHPVDTFLAESIRGYSAARNDFRSTP
jgi:LPS-assembly protein